MAHKQDVFNKAKANLAQALNVNIRVAPHALNQHYYSAGTAEERLSDFHTLIADDSVKAIIFSGGGDTAIDLVAHLDYELIKSHPKIIAGISDATTVLSPITAKTGLITFLGLEFLDFADYQLPYTVASIKQQWFTGGVGDIHANPDWRDLDTTYTTYAGWQTIRAGEAEGRLVGGNSESFIQLLDTDYELILPNSILFIETYRLPKKQIHKALMQLKLRGVLDRINGLIMGYCLESDDPQRVGNDQPLAETILEVTEAYDFPIMQIGEIGHRVENCLQPYGARVQMDATRLTFTLREDVTT